MKEVWTDVKVIGFFGTVFIAVYAITHIPDTWQLIREIIRLIKGG